MARPLGEPGRTVSAKPPVWKHVRVPVAVMVVEVAFMLTTRPIWNNHTVQSRELIGESLRLTLPGDYILDMKGETVFRRRPYFYTLETFTMTRLERGLIMDDIPKRLVATRTCVATYDDSRLPSRARSFISDNYLPVGLVRVAGKYLDDAQVKPEELLQFEIQIPARYMILSRHGSVDGLLDGTPNSGARFLDPGPHSFQPKDAQGLVVAIWDRAIEKHFTPFDF
jgi:hypothetical protein